MMNMLANMRAATFEMPSSIFEVKWGSEHRPDNHNIDRFRLYGHKWHWHRSCKNDPNEVEMGTSESLRGIAQLFSTQNEYGEALYAQFFCAPRIESIMLEGKEDSLAIFPLDAILEELENVFSRIEFAYLEYGAGRQWMVVRFSDWAPSHFLSGTYEKSSHLFWFDAEGIESVPQLVYINHEMPEDLSNGDNWKTWEVLLRSDEHLILCTAPRGQAAVCHRLDLSAEPGAFILTPMDFLFSSSKCLMMTEEEGSDSLWGNLKDAWGHLIFGDADLDSLGLEWIHPDE